MTDDRSLERAARSWIEAGPTRAPDHVVEAALQLIDTTPQERDLRLPRRITMPTIARVAAAAAIGVLLVGGALFMLGSPEQTGVGGPGPSATPTASPTPIPSPTGPPALHEGELTAGTYAVFPFTGPDAAGVCSDQAGCTESPVDDTIRFTFTVPDGWAGAPFNSLWLPISNNLAPDGAGLIFLRGGWLYSNPCGGPPPPDIPVGPSVDDFASALAEHPTLGATTPVDVTLGGYSGKFLEFQAPADVSACPASFFPWEPGLYAQGPSQGWHVWILDVDGTRVVVLTNDYPGTSAENRAELQAIVDSIQIEP